jgi:hypothetical protein
MLISVLVNCLFKLSLQLDLKEPTGKFETTQKKIWELLGSTDYVSVDDISLVIEEANKLLENVPKQKEIEKKSWSNVVNFVKPQCNKSQIVPMPAKTVNQKGKRKSPPKKYINNKNWDMQFVLGVFMTKSHKINDQNIKNATGYYGCSNDYMKDLEFNEHTSLFGRDVLYDSTGVNPLISEIIKQKEKLHVGNEILDESSRYEFILIKINMISNMEYQYVFHQRFHHRNITFPASQEHVVFMYTTKIF